MLLIKQITDVALGAELDEHLADDSAANRKKSAPRKTVKTTTD